MADDTLRQHLLRAAAAETGGPQRLEALRAAGTYLARADRVSFSVDGAACAFEAPRRWLEVPASGCVTLTDARGGSARWPFADELYVGLWCRPRAIRAAALLRLEGAYGGGLSIALLADGSLRASLSDGGSATSTTTLKGGLLRANEWRHVALRIADDAKEARRRSTPETPKRRLSLLERKPSQKSGRLGVLAGGAELLIDGVVEDRDTLASAPRLSSPELRHADAASDGFAGAVAGLVILSRSPGRSASAALAWRFTGDVSCDGASTVAQDAASGLARRAALDLTREPPARKAFLSPQRRPSEDAEGVVFDVGGGTGDARAPLVALGGPVAKCTSRAAHEVRARSRAIALSAAAAALRRGGDPVGALVCALDGDRGSTALLKCAPKECTVRVEARPRDALRRLGGAASWFPALAQLADRAVMNEERDPPGSLRARLSVVDGLVRCCGDDFLRCGGVEILERCLDARPTRNEDVAPHLVAVLDGILESAAGLTEGGDALLERFVDRVACNAPLWGATSGVPAGIVAWCRAAPQALDVVRRLGLDAYLQRVAYALASAHTSTPYTFRHPHLSLTPPLPSERKPAATTDAAPLRAITALSALPASGTSVDGELDLDGAEGQRAVLRASLALADDACACAALSSFSAFEPEALQRLAERGTIDAFIERGFGSASDALAVECLALSVLVKGADGAAAAVEAYWRRHPHAPGPLTLDAFLELSGSAVLRACAVAFARFEGKARGAFFAYCAALDAADAAAADAACAAVLGEDASGACDASPSAGATLLSLCSKRPPTPRDRAVCALCLHGSPRAMRAVAAYALQRNDPRLLSRVVHAAHEHGAHSFIGAAPSVASVAQRGLIDVTGTPAPPKNAASLRRSIEDLTERLDTEPKRYERSGDHVPLPPLGVTAHGATSVYTSLQVAECLDALLAGEEVVATDDVDVKAGRALDRVAALDTACSLDGRLLLRLATKDLARVADRLQRNLERWRRACTNADVAVAERVAQRRQTHGPSAAPADDGGRASLLALKDAHDTLRRLITEPKAPARDAALVSVHALLTSAAAQLTSRQRPVLPRHAQAAVQAMTATQRVRASSFGDDWDQVVGSDANDVVTAPWLQEALEVHVAGADGDGRTAAFSSASDRRYNESLKLLAGLSSKPAVDVVVPPPRRLSDAGRALRRRDRKRAKRASVTLGRAWRAAARGNREAGAWCVEDAGTTPLIPGGRWTLARHADAFGRRAFFVRDRDPVDVHAWAHQGGAREEVLPPPPLKPTHKRVGREDSGGSSSDEDAVLIERGVPSQPSRRTSWRFVEDGGVVTLEDELFRDEHCVWVRGDDMSLIGTLTATAKELRFTSIDEVRIWRFAAIERVAPRRYLLRRVAFEFFRCDSTSVFLALPRGKAHRALAKLLKALLKRRKLPLLNRGFANGHAGRRVEGDDNGGLGYRDAERTLRLSRLTDLWRRRLLTNFAYLSALNELAGRTRQDLAQWPVFPWVLAFDTDTEPDLKHGLRDLSKPIGAQTEARRAQFLERYETFEDPSGWIPKFMYGSHYSSAGVVLHYLVRALPYSKLAVELQGGRLDVPDRLFLGMSAAWRSTTQSMTDVKESIPELYYAPEMLANMNALPLGTSQSGDVVDDVLLPAWCAQDPLKFIRVHRAALESEIVSDSLHQWIDLVFGDAQQGPKAVERANVFYHLTYEGAVDVDLIEDQGEREATDAQIAHFGQTPPKLFSAPHPKRKAPAECAAPLFSDVPLHGECPAVSCRAYVLDEVKESQRLFGPDAPLGEKPPKQSTFVKDAARFAKQLFAPKKKVERDRAPVLGVALYAGATQVQDEATQPVVCAFHADRNVTVWRWSEVPDGRGAPFSARPHGAGRLDVCARTYGDGNTVCALADRRVLTVGHSDGRVRLHDGKGVLKAATRGPHAGGSANVCCGSGHVAVTGGADGVVAVWVCDDQALACGLQGAAGSDEDEDDETLAPSRSIIGADDSDDVLVCSHVLAGHASRITALAYSPVLDVCVSADADGDLVIHACRAGRCLRTMKVGPCTKFAILDVDAAVVVAAATTLSLWSLNGGRRAAVTVPSPTTSLATTKAGTAVVCGSLDGRLVVRRAFDLSAVHAIDLSTHGALLALAFGPDDRHLLVATAGGRIVVCADPRSRLLQLDAALSNAVGLDTGLFAF